MERLDYERNNEAAQIIANHYGRAPVAFVRSFGCQQSVNDGEKIRGVLLDCGYTIASTPAEADLILFNTCAVREHAEQRVFGNLGALKALKTNNPSLLIGICGCMAEQKSTIDKLRESYAFVDMVLGVNAADKIPGAVVEKLTTRKKALRVPPIEEEIIEGVPQQRDSTYKAFLPIMYGCDNFCSYCIVPYVRGRERSRTAADILAEFKQLVNDGYKEITLLGQNVNSYGKGLEEKYDFSGLLTLLCQTKGDYKLRFLTSHPKDATRKMVDTMLENDHICKHLHLPVQCGSNDLLARMNRKYTVEDYLALIRYAKEVAPEMTFSTDIMVGFPGESEEDFEKTIELVREVKFTQLFTYIYSKRIGTEAAEQPDNTPHKVKSERISRLLDLQEGIVAELAKDWIGKQYVGIIDGGGREDGVMSARIDNNMIVEFECAEGVLGEWVTLEVTAVKGSVLRGKQVK